MSGYSAKDCRRKTRYGPANILHATIIHISTTMIPNKMNTGSADFRSFVESCFPFQIRHAPHIQADVAVMSRTVTMMGIARICVIL